jgi:trigger factor
VPASALEATEEELNNHLDNFLKNYGTAEKITDRAVEAGDKVNLDYVGTVNGAAFSGGNTMGLGTDVTAGSDEYVDDFLDQIIGHMPGETIEINVTFPDDYGDAVDTDGNPMVLSGADAVFTTTINYIHGDPIKPELTDAWVKENFAQYGMETVEDVRQDIRDYFAEKKMYDYVTNYLLENSVFEPFEKLPYAVLNDTACMMLFSNNSYAQSLGASLEDWLEVQGFESIEAYLNASAASIMKEVHTVLLIQALCEEMNVGATAEDAAKLLGSYYESYVSNYGPNYTNAYVNSTICFNAVVNNATVVE